MTHARIAEIFKTLGAEVSPGKLAVTSPHDGAPLASLAEDNAKTLSAKLAKAKAAQAKWNEVPRRERVSVLEAYAAALKSHGDMLGEIIHLEAGKTAKEARGEADGSAEIVLKTLRDATLPDLSNMERVKERPAAGVVGLITSFNFPMVVAHWTLAPALLARNAVLWKPSEKTPISALACKAVWDQANPVWADLFHPMICGRAVGAAMVAHEDVDMISATGSVGMGQAIKKALSAKKNNAQPPILELGGNNGVIISEKISPEHLEWSVKALLNSFLGTTGQRCTNTRRLIVHREVQERVVSMLQRHIEVFLESGLRPDNEYGYGPLIDEGAYQRLEKSIAQAASEGGKVIYGKRIAREGKGAYVEPALALMPTQTQIMHEETFAPILFIVPYEGGIEEAIALLNAPANAGLVSGIYTLSRSEADAFALHSAAGHALINAPKGTGTPAHGMGFGGNKASGEGEILNSVDPLQAFTRRDSLTRIARNKDIALDQE